jgi:hypothetical protein
MLKNLQSELEHHRRLIISGIVIICLAAIAVTARRDPFAYDLFWHLQTGLDWLKNGLSPWVDHYSITEFGEKVSGPPFLFQVTIATLVDHFGLEYGTQLFKFIVFISVFAFILIFLIRIKSPTITYVLVLPSVVVALQLRAMTRPELIGYVFGVLAVMLYHRANAKVSAQTVLPMVLLMIIWENYHAAIFGYIIFFGFFIDVAMKNFHDRSTLREWVRWAAWGLAIVAAGFIKPSPGYGVFGIFNFNPEWKLFIEEYEPTLELYGALPPVYGLLLIMIAAALIALKQRKFGYLFVCVFLFFQSFQISRLVTPSSLIVLCILASMLSQKSLSEMKSRFNETVEWLGGLTLAGIACLSLTYSVILARSIMYENKTSLPRFPVSIADYMEETGISGNIFNEYDTGGYLIYRLAPESRVYIDGRTNILYSFDHYKRYLDARNDPKALLSDMDELDIKVAVLRNDPQAFAVTYNTGRLAPDFFGPRYTLFVEKDANFPALGRTLAYPACWNTKMVDDLQAEYIKALMLIPQNSFALPYLRTVLAYSNSEYKSNFLTELGKLGTVEENAARFLGYQSMERSLAPEALNFLTKTDYWELGDYLVAAIAHIELSQWQQAESLLDKSTRIAWRNVTPGQITLLYQLIRDIRSKLENSAFSEEYLEGLRENINDYDTNIESDRYDLSLLCND